MRDADLDLVVNTNALRVAPEVGVAARARNLTRKHEGPSPRKRPWLAYVLVSPPGRGVDGYRPCGAQLALGCRRIATHDLDLADLDACRSALEGRCHVTDDDGRRPSPGEPPQGSQRVTPRPRRHQPVKTALGRECPLVCGQIGKAGVAPRERQGELQPTSLDEALERRQGRLPRPTLPAGDALARMSAPLGKLLLGDARPLPSDLQDVARSHSINCIQSVTAGVTEASPAACRIRHAASYRRTLRSSRRIERSLREI